jgi:hypothetical protein
MHHDGTVTAIAATAGPDAAELAAGELGAAGADAAEPDAAGVDAAEVAAAGVAAAEVAGAEVDGDDEPHAARLPAMMAVAAIMNTLGDTRLTGVRVVIFCSFLGKALTVALVRGLSFSGKLAGGEIRISPPFSPPAPSAGGDKPSMKPAGA